MLILAAVLIGALFSGVESQCATGCAYNGTCVAVGFSVIEPRGYQCINVTCKSNNNIVETSKGCFYQLNSTCYVANGKVRLNKCASQTCQKSATTANFSWKRVFNGCFTDDGACVLDGTTFSDDCVQNTCRAKPHPRWITHRLGSSDCTPSSSPCSIDNVKGCAYQGSCYPVTAVIKEDNCLQYVCYIDSSATDPYWLERPTGCYSPVGCLGFGQTYSDETKGVYRCELDFAVSGVKYTRYVPPCTTPDGQILGLGETVQVGQYLYSCTTTGLNTFDTLYQYPPQKQTCGPYYKGEPFYTPQGICSYQTYYCRLTCTYFVPLGFNELGEFRYLGDQWISSENRLCTCTADYNINNFQYTQGKSLWNTPVLCGQVGVTDGACADPNDGSVHQWSELWATSPNVLCTCHPVQQQAFCSSDVVAVVNATSVLKVPVLV